MSARRKIERSRDVRLPGLKRGFVNSGYSKTVACLLRCNSSLRRASSLGAAATALEPFCNLNPASSQPIVPFSKATTGLGMPARTNDSVPRMLLVRPAQLTTTVMFSFNRSNTRYTRFSSRTGTPAGYVHAVEFSFGSGIKDEEFFALS